MPLAYCSRVLTPCLFLMIFASHVSAQISQRELTGTWKVTQVLLDSSQATEEMLVGMKSFENALLKSTFTFEPTHVAKANIPIEDLRIAKAAWKYDSIAKTLDIVEWEDRLKPTSGLLMRIFVEKREDTFLFIMHETPYVLLVRKTVNPSSR